MSISLEREIEDAIKQSRVYRYFMSDMILHCTLEKYKTLPDHLTSLLTKSLTAIVERESSIWKEKYEILEKERQEWWSKADKPDECYVPISVLEREKIKARIETQLEDIS